MSSDVITETGMPRPVGGFGKRLFDIAFATIALMSFSLILIAVAAIIKLKTGGPIFFVHKRVGLNGEIFPCLKFRTMVPDAAERLKVLMETDPAAAEEYTTTNKLRKDPRIIPVVGTLLRKSSLDELPQFFNVLVGQMSIVGPRPVTEDEFAANYGEHHIYTSARPGITGLWQVSGRNDIHFPQRAHLDARYVQNWSFMQDLNIVLRTINVLCLQRNGY